MLENDPEKRISSKDLLTELTKLDSKNLTKNIGIIVRSFLLIYYKFTAKYDLNVKLKIYILIYKRERKKRSVNTRT